MIQLKDTYIPEMLIIAGFRHISMLQLKEERSKKINEMRVGVEVSFSPFIYLAVWRKPVLKVLALFICQTLNYLWT